MDFTQAEQDIVEIKHQDLWNGGYVKMFDFSKANSSEAHRIHAVTMIANVCRGDKGIKDREALYKQLLTEHAGQAGEVFQFVPTITEAGRMQYRITEEHEVLPMNIARFGIKEKFKQLCNLRATLNDGQGWNYNEQVSGFHVFKIKIPMMIVQHILRHGQLSFMQVSERSQKLREYYYCDEFKQILDEVRYNFLEEHKDISDNELWNNICYQASQQAWDIWQNGFSIDTGDANGSKIRQELTNKGSHGLAFVTMWIAGWKQDPTQWDNFFAVRTKNPSQREIQELATVMKGMINE